MKSNRSQIIFVVVIAIAILVVAVGLILRGIGNSTAAVNPAASPGAAATALPPGSVEVKIESSNTKEDWMNEMVKDFNASGAKTSNGQAIVVTVVHGGSGTGLDNILTGSSKPVVYSPGTDVWINQLNQKWKDQYNKPLITGACPALTSEPFGIAMWKPMAEALGWPDKSIKLSDIAHLAANPQGWASVGHPEWGTFKFGHGHPDYSNSGLLTMVAAVYSAAGMRSGLTPTQVKSAQVISNVRALEQSVYHYGRLSTDLFDRMTARGPNYLHAITAFESDVVKWNLNHAAELRFPLVFIVPADATFWTNHPYCILDNADWVSADQREAAQLFQKYLLDPANQAKAVATGLRPADSSIALTVPVDLEHGAMTTFNAKNLPELEYPSDEVAAHILDVFHQVKKQATVLVIVDTSGSMSGEKIKGAVDGALSFLDNMEPNEQVMVNSFSNEITPLEPTGRVGDVREQLKQTVSGLYAGGGTALHEVVIRALDEMEQIKAQDEAKGENRLYGIVLLTDGKNDIAGGPSEADLLSRLPSGDQPGGIKLFTIAYGDDANEQLLQTLANRSNGKKFKGDPKTIRSVYLAISSEF
jgi:Ca-activated chloride channel homolog